VPYEVITMTDHIFEILGISSREDSYTDLIAYAFEHNPEFRKNFLTLLKEEDDDNWKHLIRPPVSITTDSGRKKDVPDLILFNEKTNKGLLIENKIFSEEGLKQTERYASKEFRESLENHLEMKVEKYKVDLKYFFLTLDKEIKPCSTSFKTILYSDISKCIPTTLANSTLDILLKELKERIDEYYNWPPPQENDVVLNYLKKTNRLVNFNRTFRIVTDRLLNSDLNLQKEHGITANPGSGNILLCLWYKKTWSSQEYPEETDGSKCYNIHFEFQWDTSTRKENLTLYLHYETNPYMTQNALRREVSEDFIVKYNKARNNFFNVVKEKATGEWNINKTTLRIADHSFNKNITFEELKKKANELINSMIPLIDDYLQPL